MLSYSDAYFTNQIISYLLSRIEIGQSMATKIVKVKVKDGNKSPSALMKHGNFMNAQFLSSWKVCLIASWVWDDKNGITNIKFRPNDDSVEQIKNFKKIKANIKWK